MQHEDYPDRGVYFCEWLQHKVCEDEEFVSKIILSDEATFKMNRTVNCHICVYWAPEDPHIHTDKVVKLPVLTLSCGLSYKVLIGPFFFEGTATGPVYLNMLRTSILLVPANHQLYGNEPFYFQQAGAPQRCH
jgi:hypothetical protein